MNKIKISLIMISMLLFATILSSTITQASTNSPYAVDTYGKKILASTAPTTLNCAWTTWRNIDKPDGTGDYELLSSFTDICKNPVAADCKTTTNINFRDTRQTVTCNTSLGFTCANARNQKCLDYTVRFCCPNKQPTTITTYNFPDRCGDNIVGLDEQCDGTRILASYGMTFTLYKNSTTSGPIETISINGQEYTLQLIGISEKSAVIKVNGIANTLPVPSQKTFSGLSLQVVSMTIINTSTSTTGNVTIAAKSSTLLETCADISEGNNPEGILSCTDTCTYNTSECNICTDTDGGINYEVKGDINGADRYGNGNPPRDYCGIGVNSNILMEGFCDAGFVNFISYTCPNGCNDGACLPLKENGEICTKDSECYWGNCDYDIFTDNYVDGNLNISSATKYCHLAMNKCLFYVDWMQEVDVGCTRCASWKNNGVWDNFIDTCGADNKWINYTDCTASTPYCSSTGSNITYDCNVTCVECTNNEHCPSGQTCINNKCTSINYTSDSTFDLTPRIAYWWGKVNQHVDTTTGTWMTDPDGSSGANLDKLTYCKKFYPNTFNVIDYKLENISGWRSAGNTDGPFLSTKQSYKCEQSEINTQTNIKDSSIYLSKEMFMITDKDWKNVLSLVPLTTWTQQQGDTTECQRGYGTPSNVCVYPTSIYHTETGETSVDLAQGATVTASSSVSYGPAYKALDGNIQTAWNSGSIDEGVLKLDLQSIKSFSRIDLFQNAEPYFINIYVSTDDVSYQKIVNNYTLKTGIGFTTVNNIFNFSTVNARYIKFALTDNPGQAKYPNWKTIAEIKIYGEEKKSYSSFDADSIIHFMQQYNPEKVSIVGETPQELDNLLIAQKELGTGLSQDQIQRISVNNYLSYWESYGTVIYVTNNYELALVASTYASLINAPLIIQGSVLDTPSVFEGKNIICVGSSTTSSGQNCNAAHTMETLQKLYVNKTNTDKIILVNPNDWTAKVDEEFQPDKSSGKIYELYSKTSLASPILASAKHEVIISTTSTDYNYIGSFIKTKINELMPRIINNPAGIQVGNYYIYGYLTVFSSPNTIPSQEFQGSSSNYIFYSALDQSKYADIYLNDKLPDLSVGRIQGMTSSDVSGYVERDLFYDKMLKTNNILFTARPLYEWYDGYYSLQNSNKWTSIFNKLGYNARCLAVTDFEGKDLIYTDNKYFGKIPDTWFEDTKTYNFTLKEINISLCEISPTSTWSKSWTNTDAISYIDHGGPNFAGINSLQMPYLSNSVIYTHACETCLSYDGSSFCNTAIRKGSLGFIGAVAVSWSSDTTLPRMLNDIYKEGLSLGQSFSKAYTTSFSGYMYTLLGDPTLNLNSTYMLNEALPWIY